MNRQMKAVLQSGLVIAAAWWWIARSMGQQAAPTPGAPTAGASTASASKQAKKGDIQASDIPIVIASASKPYPGETFVRERSLFEYAQSPDELAAIEESRRLLNEQQVREAEERRIRDEELRVVREKEAQERAAAQAVEAAARAEYLKAHPPKPVPPVFPYSYIGIIGPKDDAHAILKGGGNKLTYAHAGDIIDSKFRVEHVGRVAMDLTYTEPQFSGEISRVQRTTEGAAATPAASPSPAGRR